jgi:peptidoglycan/xylan/chitin deacetylase (PgdA/CDA1 family)
LTGGGEKVAPRGASFVLEPHVPRITFLFDNGPDPDVTPQVLDTLRRHDVKATFFVLGDKLRDRRALAARAHAEGQA